MFSCFLDRNVEFSRDLYVFNIKCCFSEPGPHFIGQVFIDPESSEESVAFSESSSGVSIDGNGILTLDAGSFITSTTTFSVTVGSTSVTSITDTVGVVVAPGIECLT